MLVYLLLADRDVEIVADRGIHAQGRQPRAWEAICREMETAFRERRLRRRASRRASQAINALLAEHFPRTGAPARNELPDRPVVL